MDERRITIPLFKVGMSPAVDKPLLETLHSGFIGEGPQVKEFERAIGAVVGNPVLAVNSCTAALTLAFRLAGVRPGLEVVSTPMTCAATNMAILAAGGEIIWADIDPRTGLIDPDDAERAVSIYTRALCGVDWGGTPCELGELKSVAKGYGLKLVEDAACSLGALYEGRPVGSTADFTCFSFQAIKHLTTVDGGALSVLDAGMRDRGRLMRWFGIDRDCPGRDIRCEGDIHEWGYKFHMSDVTATIGLAQLAARVHEKAIAAARANAAWYDTEFLARGIKGVKPVHRRPGRDSTFWLYTVLCDRRDEFIEHLRSWKVAASQVHKRNDLFRCFRSYLDRRLPGVDEFSRRQCSIPVGWWVSEADREHIMRAIEDFDRRTR